MILLACVVLYTIIGAWYVVSHHDVIDDCGWLAMQGDSRNVLWVLPSNFLLLPYFWSMPLYILDNYRTGGDTPFLMHAAFKFRWHFGMLGEIIFTIVGFMFHAAVVYLIWRLW